MWRGSSMNFSMKTRSSPKLAFASAWQAAKPSRASLVVVRDAQALAAAAGGRLDHHRIADVARDRTACVGVGDRRRCSRGSC